MNDQMFAAAMARYQQFLVGNMGNPIDLTTVHGFSVFTNQLMEAIRWEPEPVTEEPEEGTEESDTE